MVPMGFIRKSSARSHLTAEMAGLFHRPKNHHFPSNGGFIRNMLFSPVRLMPTYASNGDSWTLFYLGEEVSVLNGGNIRVAELQTLFSLPSVRSRRGLQEARSSNPTAEVHVFRCLCGAC